MYWDCTIWIQNLMNLLIVICFLKILDRQKEAEQVGQCYNVQLLVYRNPFQRGTLLPTALEGM